MASGTPASMAVEPERLPRWADIPENREVSKPTCDRPRTIEADTSSEDGCRERSKRPARTDHGGKSGGQTGQCEVCSARLVFQTQQADNGQQLLDRDQAGVPGHSHAWLVPLPKLVVLLHLNVERGAAPEA